MKFDLASGIRRARDMSGDKHPMFGKKHTNKTKFKMELTRESRRYALMHFMTGSFHAQPIMNESFQNSELIE